MLHKRVSADTWLALARPAKRLAIGDRIRFGGGRGRLPARHPRRHRGRKGRRRGDPPAIRFYRSRARRGDRHGRGTSRCRPISPPSGPTMRRTAPTTRPCSPTRKAPSPRRPRGLHFTPELVARLEARGIVTHRGDAACRRRHVPAGEGRRHHRPPHARRMGRGVAETAAALNAVKTRGRACRHRRHHGDAATGKRGLGRRAARGVARRDRYLHHAPATVSASSKALLASFHLPRSTLVMLVRRFYRPRWCRSACLSPCDHEWIRAFRQRHHLHRLAQRQRRMLFNWKSV